MNALHPWMYRFGFPGFAEVEWVLPAGVLHDEPWYEPLPAVMAMLDLQEWSLQAHLEERLRELHAATFGEPLFEPAGTPFYALVEPLREMLERGRIVAWVLRGRHVSAPGRMPSVPPPAPPSGPPPVKTTWIEIELVDQNGKPVASEPYRVTPPDGPARTGTLDDRGFARVDGITPGTCEVTFPKIDGREWSANGPSKTGDVRETSSAFSHRTGPNDCLSSIAAAYGFRAWRTVYDNGPNGDLRDLRRDPNVLAAGDTVWIDRFERIETRGTEARHRFVTVTAPTMLRLRLERMKPQRYALTIGRETIERDVPESLLIEHPIPPSETSAELKLFFDDAEPAFELVWKLDVGALRPVDLVRGVKERLNNLGFAAGKETEEEDAATQRAVAAFQTKNGEPATGVIDDPLREKVRAKHDVS